MSKGPRCPRALAVALGVTCVFFSSAVAQVDTRGSSASSYRRSIESWRAEHEARLKADDGWLTLAGLYWLRNGVNQVGGTDGGRGAAAGLGARPSGNDRVRGSGRPLLAGAGS